MIQFNKDLITIEVVKLKSITQALGGSIQIVDEEKTVGKKEVYKKIKAPLAVTRAFIMKHSKVTKYIKPVYTAVVRYDGRIISLERHPMGMMGELVVEGLDGQPIVWTPFSRLNLDSLIYPLMKHSGKDWFFDGRYAYTTDFENFEVAVEKAEALSTNNQFRKIPVTAIDFQELSNADKLQPHNRDCIAFVADEQSYAVSPPIWKNVASIGSTSGRGKDEDDMNDVSIILTNATDLFDRIDSNMAVNVNFALKAGAEIGALFGYEYIDPLQLPMLMITLHTVNLPNVSKNIKATYDIGLPFTHAMAWLLGLSLKADTLDTHIAMRSLMKYLTKKGIFRSNSFDAAQIFKTGMSMSDIDTKDLNVLLEEKDFTRSSLLTMLEQSGSARKKAATRVRQISSSAE